MEGIKNNKNKRATTNTSNKTNVKKVPSEVSSDELLEQIINKKKNNKKSSTKKITTISSDKKNVVRKSVSKKTKQFNNLENDFIYDQILSNKRSKNNKTSKVDKKVKVQEDNVVLDKTKTIEELEALLPVEEEKEEYSTYNSLEESVKRKKEHKDEFELFLTEIENEKLLKQIKEALEHDQVEYIRPEYKVYSKDAIAKIDSEISERIKNRALGEVNKNKKIKSNYIPIGLFILAFLCVGILVCIIVNSIVSDKGSNISYGTTIVDEEEEKARILKEQQLKDEYDNCLVRLYDENDLSLQSNIDALNSYFVSTYKLSVLYNDYTSGFSYIYNQNQMYYAASTMKSLAAMYVYEKAYLGELDLNATVKYTRGLKMGSSAGMINHKIGDLVSLRDLVKYSITLSDNTAHNMIVSYVGINNVKNYGLGMGATLSHTNNDLFGYINVSDSKIYLDKLYYLFYNTGEYGTELEDYYLNADQNYLNLEDKGIVAAHKYGEYENIYHDMGIIYDEHPYSIVILTNEGRNNHELVIRDVNSKINELHNLFYSNRESYCNSLIYGK